MYITYFEKNTELSKKLDNYGNNDFEFVIFTNCLVAEHQIKANAARFFVSLHKKDELHTGVQKYILTFILCI
jgi:hypothetical protein